MASLREAAEARAYDAELALIDADSVTESALRDSLALLQRRHIAAVLEERALLGRCGLPTCGKATAKTAATAAGTAAFCSAECAVAAKRLLGAADDAPLLSRAAFADLISSSSQQRAPKTVGERLAAATIVEHDDDDEADFAEAPTSSATATATAVEGFDTSAAVPTAANWLRRPIDGSFFEDNDDVDDDDEDESEGEEGADEEEEEATEGIARIELGRTPGFELSDCGWASMALQSWGTAATSEFLASQTAAPVTPQKRRGTAEDEEQRRSALLQMLLETLSSLSECDGIDSAPLRADIADIVNTFAIRSPLRPFTSRQLVLLALTLAEHARRRRAARDPKPFADRFSAAVKRALGRNHIAQYELEALLRILP